MCHSISLRKREHVSQRVDDRLIQLDENPETPAMLGVRGIPALFIFKGGEAVSNRIGAAPKAALAQWISGFA